MTLTETNGTMKSFLTIAFTAGTLALTAQNANVVNAYNYMNDGQLAKAVEFIEPATTDAKTGASEKTWRYRGDIYRLIAMGTDQAVKDQFPQAMDKAVESYLKADELDAKGNNKEENMRALGALQGLSLNSGNDAFTAKDYDKAIANYARSEKIAKAFGQTDTNAIFNSALAYESKGDHAGAITRYREALTAGYHKPEIYRYIASLERKQENLDGAITTIGEGRKAYPDNKDLILDEMSYLLAANRSAEAEESVKLGLQKDPNNAILWSVLASLYDKKASDATEEAVMTEWYGKAEEAYKKSLELDPKFFDSYFNIGVLYNNRAAFEYEKCNKIKSDAEYTKCKTVADDIYVKAVPFFEKAHELKTDDVPTIQQLMKLYAKTGDQAKYATMKGLLKE
ncbi:MAG: tetratricopeptide repeat protein [Flavobacteriales bacterium]|nr:tetratricopeptide repeat protein [Flavobacteriales bacterium]MBP7155313.1 tetratricopeptide repeat protein [Flavobacteriales bacterium]HQW40828.1 tetratricopeptide repeat protein [Flavobacteriales bacterium]